MPTRFHLTGIQGPNLSPEGDVIMRNRGESSRKVSILLWTLQVLLAALFLLPAG